MVIPIPVGNGKPPTDEECLAERTRWAASVLRNCVESAPLVRSGVPVLKGTRFTISQLFAELAEGRSSAQIADDFDLDVELIKQLLQGFATHLDRPIAP